MENSPAGLIFLHCVPQPSEMPPRDMASLWLLNYQCENPPNEGLKLCSYNLEELVFIINFVDVQRREAAKPNSVKFSCHFQGVPPLGDAL